MPPSASTDRQPDAHKASPLVFSVFPGTIVICGDEENPHRGTPPVLQFWKWLVATAGAVTALARARKPAL